MYVPPGTLVLEPRDDLDCAIVAVEGGLALYDLALLTEAFMRAEGWSREDALEWIDFNVDPRMVVNSEPID